MLKLFRAASRLSDGVFWYALMLALLATYGIAALGPILHMVAVEWPERYCTAG